jgi:AmmeMemoRadiSam system protein A
MEAHEKRELLRIARRAIERGAAGLPLDELDVGELPPSLRADGACFVTLTARGALRGCIGSLVAVRPLAVDVHEHAVDAAVNDFRFPPVTADEVAGLRIELSVLSPARPLEYSGPEDLLRKLRPGVDGVVLHCGRRRATFLPQVWEKVPDQANSWGCFARRWDTAEVMAAADDGLVYQVESFEEDSGR